MSYPELTADAKSEAIREEIACNLTKALKMRNIQLNEKQIKEAFDEIENFCDSCAAACMHFVLL